MIPEKGCYTEPSCCCLTYFAKIHASSDVSLSEVEPEVELDDPDEESLEGPRGSPPPNSPTYQTRILQSAKMEKMGEMGKAEKFLRKWGEMENNGEPWRKLGQNGGKWEEMGKPPVIAHGMWVVEGCGGMIFAIPDSSSQPYRAPTPAHPHHNNHVTLVLTPAPNR